MCTKRGIPFSSEGVGGDVKHISSIIPGAMQAALNRGGTAPFVIYPTRGEWCGKGECFSSDHAQRPAEQFPLNSKKRMLNATYQLGPLHFGSIKLVKVRCSWFPLSTPKKERPPELIPIEGIEPPTTKDLRGQGHRGDGVCFKVVYGHVSVVVSCWGVDKSCPWVCHSLEPSLGLVHLHGDGKGCPHPCSKTDVARDTRGIRCNCVEVDRVPEGEGLLVK